MTAVAVRKFDVVYSEADAPPADDGLRWEWATMIVGELRRLLAGKKDVVVGGDMPWFPTESDKSLCVTPAALVAFDRPKRYRGSYRQWEENGAAPQVVFELVAPGRTDDELDARFDFYQDQGVEEYYLIDPYDPAVEGYRRRNNRLAPVRRVSGSASPRLGVRFEVTADAVTLFRPDGKPFMNAEDRVRSMGVELRKVQEEVEAERRAKEALAAELRSLGLDPDAMIRAAG